MPTPKTTSLLLALLCLLIGTTLVHAADPPSTPRGPALSPTATPIFKTINESITVGGGAPALPKIVTETIVVDGGAPALPKIVAETIVVGSKAPAAPSVVTETIVVGTKDGPAAINVDAMKESQGAATGSAQKPTSEKGAQESRPKSRARDAFSRSTGATMQTAVEPSGSGFLTSPWMLTLYVAIALVGAVSAFLLGRKLRESN
jgi:hypothetical protein